MENVIADQQVIPKNDSVNRPKLPLWVRALIAFSASSFALAALPVLILLGTYFYYMVTGLIMPGVHVGGIPLQGLSVQQARTVIDQVWNVNYRISLVDVSGSNLEREVPPSVFGLGVDAQLSAELAQARGRGVGPIVGITQMIDAWLNGWTIQPWVTYDTLTARSAVESWAAEFHLAAVDADLFFDGGEIVRVAAQPGRSLDVEATLELLSADPASILLKYRFAPLVINAVEPSTPDVTPAADEAERLIGSLPSIRAYDPVTDEFFEWTPSRLEISSWLRIERAAEEVGISLDSDRLTAYVEALNASLGEERGFDQAEGMAAASLELQGGDSAVLLIRYKPTSYVVQRGDTLVSISLQVGIPYWKIVQYNPQVAVSGLSVGSAIVMPPKDAMLELPVVINKRIVISLSQQHMWVYQDGIMIRDHVVSTGIASSPTMAGIFQVKSHYLNAYASRWDLYMPHFLGIYDATPHLENGIHGLPLLSSGVRLWANVLGRPASYGCIILTLQAAEELYAWADDGVVVEIRR